ncbi:MAG TPA: hypothetical protein VGK67_14060 [Myxococcales bacterium]|jgi:hypothetical protein
MNAREPIHAPAPARESRVDVDGELRVESTRRRAGRPHGEAEPPGFVDRSQRPTGPAGVDVRDFLEWKARNPGKPYPK